MRSDNPLKSRLRLTLGTLVISSSLGACAIVPLDHHGQPVAVSPAEAVVSTAIVTFGVLHFLSAFTHGRHGGRSHWRGRGRGHRGGHGRGRGGRHRH